MGELHIIKVACNQRAVMDAFLYGLNLSMSSRSKEDPRIPYNAMTEEELIWELNSGYSTFILNEDEGVIGGVQ